MKILRICVFGVVAFVALATARGKKLLNRKTYVDAKGIDFPNDRLSSGDVLSMAQLSLEMRRLSDEIDSLKTARNRTGGKFVNFCKLAFSSNVVAALIVGLLGVWLTWYLNGTQTDRENRYKEFELVAKFASYLSSERPSDVEFAILAIYDIGNTNLAMRLGERNFDRGGSEALMRLSRNNPDVSDAYHNSIGIDLAHYDIGRRFSALQALAQSDLRPPQYILDRVFQIYCESSEEMEIGGASTVISHWSQVSKKNDYLRAEIGRHIPQIAEAIQERQRAALTNNVIAQQLNVMLDAHFVLNEENSGH